MLDWSKQDCTSFYTHLITHIVPGPNNLTYFVPLLLLPTSLCIPPQTLSQKQLGLIFLPIILACLAHSWRLMHGIDVISVDLLFWSFDLLVCYCPREDFHKVRFLKSHHQANNGDITLGETAGPSTEQHGNPGDRSEAKSSHAKQNFGRTNSQIEESNTDHFLEPYPEALTHRIVWVMTLLPSLRFTHWHINQPSHDAHQPPARISRVAYLRTALIAIPTGWIILDMTSLYTTKDPYFHSSTNVDTPLPISLPCSPFVQHLPPRFVRTALLSAQVFALIPRLFYLSILPTLALDYFNLLPDEWNPRTWPPFFGPFSAIPNHGLRGLWGTWWHQMNRYLTSTPGRCLADCLHLPARSASRYALLVISGFGLSGVMHMGLIPPEPLGTTMSAMEMRFWVAGFFWMQILGIAVEWGVGCSVERFASRVKEWKMACGW